MCEFLKPSISVLFLTAFIISTGLISCRRCFFGTSSTKPCEEPVGNQICEK